MQNPQGQRKKGEKLPRNDVNKFSKMGSRQGNNNISSNQHLSTGKNSDEYSQITCSAIGRLRIEVPGTRRQDETRKEELCTKQRVIKHYGPFPFLQLLAARPLAFSPLLRRLEFLVLGKIWARETQNYLAQVWSKHGAQNSRIKKSLQQ